MAGWEEALGKVLVSGFGPDVVQGFIAKYIERIPAVKCREYILAKRDLFKSVSERQWGIIRKAVHTGKIEVSYEKTIEELSSYHPDLLAIISCTDGGVDWLRLQVEEAKKKLTS
ncbi:MAG: hypothetical protein Q8O55_01410 [Dehalococcoidales bacterium]|nr:hypothetical protein [Dehalococcoidales bacterium]